MENKIQLTEATFQGPWGIARVSIPQPGVYKVEHVAASHWPSVCSPSFLRDPAVAARTVMVLTQPPGAIDGDGSAASVPADVIQMIHAIAPVQGRIGEGVPA